MAHDPLPQADQPGNNEGSSTIPSDSIPLVADCGADSLGKLLVPAIPSGYQMPGAACATPSAEAQPKSFIGW